MACRKMIGTKWGLNPKRMEWLYTGVVRPVMTYGSIAIATSLEKQSIINKLNKLQRLACLTTLNAIKSTPTAGMEVILDIPPLNIYMKTVAIQNMIRIKRLNQWRYRDGETPWNKSHAYVLSKWERNLPRLMDVTDTDTKTTRIAIKYNTDIQTRDTLSIVTKRPKPYDTGCVNCFTDGSKVESGCGAGYIVWTDKKIAQDHFPLGKHTSVYQAELLAISTATQDMLNRKIKNKTINYHIDSQSAIKALDSYNNKNKIVNECKNNLNKLATHNTITLNWVPGHEGHMGNEVADRLAKTGANMTVEGPEPIIPVPNSVVTGAIREWGRGLHQKHWEERKDCRQTKMFIPQINIQHRKEILQSTRNNSRKITQILTGHANLNRHLHIMGLVDTPLCPKCEEEEETVQHYISTCPFYSRIRHSIFGQHTISETELQNIKHRQILAYIVESKRW